MATKTSEVPTFDSADFEAATQRAAGLNVQFTELGRKVGHAYLDAGEKNLATVLGFNRKVAAATQIAAFQAVTDAQIKLVQDMATSYTKTAREMLA